MMEYKTVHDRITGLMETKDMEKLKVFHREMEISNARMILDNRDDKILKDVEFLVRSAIVLSDLGKEPGDWMLQLRAALAILEGPPPSS